MDLRARVSHIGRVPVASRPERVYREGRLYPGMFIVAVGDKGKLVVCSVLRAASSNRVYYGRR